MMQAKETVKQTAERIARNDLTWPCKVIIKFLESFFKHHPYFNWNEDLKLTNVAILDSHTETSSLAENVDRVIIQRKTFTGQSIVTDNRVKVDNKMFTHSIVKPRLGYINIFCESRNSSQAEYIATQVENVLLMHKSELLEMNVGIGDPSLSDVQDPRSGSGFFSMMITIPTIVVGESEFSVKSPEMLNHIELAMGIDSVLGFQVETQ